jgi:hypothetical protein
LTDVLPVGQHPQNPFTALAVGMQVCERPFELQIKALVPSVLHAKAEGHTERVGANVGCFVGKCVGTCIAAFVGCFVGGLLGGSVSRKVGGLVG